MMVMMMMITHKRAEKEENFVTRGGKTGLAVDSTVRKAVLKTEHAFG